MYDELFSKLGWEKLFQIGSKEIPTTKSMKLVFIFRVRDLRNSFISKWKIDERSKLVKKKNISSNFVI